MVRNYVRDGVKARNNSREATNNIAKMNKNNVKARNNDMNTKRNGIKVKKNYANAINNNTKGKKKTQRQEVIMQKQE